MTPLTLEWIDKAEEDFHVAQREGRARKNPSFNAACFHAHQCAEKYLKARLQEAGIAFPRTHVENPGHSDWRLAWLGNVATAAMGVEGWL